MSIFALLLLIFILTGLLFLAVFGYLQLYQRNINRALEEKKQARRPMAPPHRVAVVLLVIVATVAAWAVLSAILVPGGIPARSARSIEEYAHQRAFSKGMSVEIMVTDQLAAVLYYKDDGSGHSFELYENTGGVIENYAFRHGGSDTSIARSVRAFRYGGELALLSMNELGIARMVCHDGTTHLLDPDRPFVVIIPSGGVDLYDADGNPVDLAQNWWYVTVKE